MNILKYTPQLLFVWTFIWYEYMTALIYFIYCSMLICEDIYLYLHRYRYIYILQFLNAHPWYVLQSNAKPLSKKWYNVPLGLIRNANS